MQTIRASHILVESLDKAAGLRNDIISGRKFEDVASCMSSIGFLAFVMWSGFYLPALLPQLKHNYINISEGAK